MIETHSLNVDVTHTVLSTIMMDYHEAWSIYPAARAPILQLPGQVQRERVCQVGLALTTQHLGLPFVWACE